MLINNIHLVMYRGVHLGTIYVFHYGGQSYMVLGLLQVVYFEGDTYWDISTSKSS